MNGSHLGRALSSKEENWKSQELVPFIENGKSGGVPIIYQKAFIHFVLAHFQDSVHMVSTPNFQDSVHMVSTPNFQGQLTPKSEVLGSIPGLATYFRFSFC